MVVAALTLATSAWAGHAHIEITIPVDTIVKTSEGSITQLATTEVPEEFAGHLCLVRAHAENQASTHPGNDLLVASGDSQVVFRDVEALPGQVIDAEEMLELGEIITVSLVMGPDEIFSAGIEVQVECLPDETTTTSTTSTTSTTTTTMATSTTTTTIATTTTAEVSPTEVTTSTTLATTTTAEVSPTEVSTSPPTTIADEVKGTEVLPFTGSGSTQIGLVALAFMAGGVLLVLGARRADD